ncbi:MAG: cytochrome-c oxidase, cbb3-type subunit III [Candidatus Azosocius agrarius]|nr:MAG: cytochrome-c oxidase, cbb3-type subunit III [Gammaproteobacteria bacterium]
MNNFWNLCICFVILVNIFGYGLFLYYTKNIKLETKVHENFDHMVEYDHYDEIEELNEPLPKWWYWMFLVSIFYGILYLICYPGLGKFSGVLNWTSSGECTSKIEQQKKVYNDFYNVYKNINVENLSINESALKIGRNLFLNNCSSCHGYDAKGSKGFPNLTNNIWLYGGTVNDIKDTITNGRNGRMPPLGQFIGNDEDIKCVALYVQSLSINKNYDEILLSKGRDIFNKICVLCHGKDALGDKMKGAPNLVNPQWIYGSSLEDIMQTVKYGRSGDMPSHKHILTEEQIHIVTAYIYSLNK